MKKGKVLFLDGSVLLCFDDCIAQNKNPDSLQIERLLNQKQND